MNLLTHLLIYNLIISFLLYASLAYNPRIWMHRMPPEVVQKVPPRTPAEKRQLYFFGVPFLLILVIYPIGYVLSQDVGFLDRFLIFGAFFCRVRNLGYIGAGSADFLQTDTSVYYYPWDDL
jgi:hypothetical protein